AWRVAGRPSRRHPPGSSSCRPRRRGRRGRGSSPANHRRAVAARRLDRATALEYPPMKFLCLDCDQPMKLHSTAGPDEGSLAVTFRCPECGFRVAMLTNPFETQMVRSLGVKVGGASPVPAPPFEHLRGAMAE